MADRSPWRGRRRPNKQAAPSTQPETAQLGWRENKRPFGVSSPLSMQVHDPVRSAADSSGTCVGSAAAPAGGSTVGGDHLRDGTTPRKDGSGTLLSPITVGLFTHGGGMPEVAEGHQRMLRCLTATRISQQRSTQPGRSSGGRFVSSIGPACPRRLHDLRKMPGSANCRHSP